MLTLEDYWAVEFESPHRHEYFDGAIYAMAGGGIAPQCGEFPFPLTPALSPEAGERGNNANPRLNEVAPGLPPAWRRSENPARVVTFRDVEISVAELYASTLT